MRQITLNARNDADINLIIGLATRLGMDVNRLNNNVPKKTTGEKLANILENIAEMGGITSIVNPVKWQSEMRKDSKLPFPKK